MEAIVIAPAHRGDSSRLAAMSRRLVESGLEPCWTSERIDRHRRHADSIVLTARAAGTICGFAIMQYGDDAAHLNLLAVERSHQRRGIGRQLVGWLEDTARVAGTFAIRLEIRESNRVARAFYAALGYQQTGWVRGYYQGVEDALRYERNLGVRHATGVD
jgi:ribosomal protein S18 acetylase RimI-like enzyme